MASPAGAASPVLLLLERIADRTLPRSEAARAVLIPLLLMGFYAAFNAWAMRVAGPIDFPVYYLGAVSFLSGDIPYGMEREAFDAFGREVLGIERFGYPYYYPPFVAFLVAPLTLLDVNGAAWVWNMANAAAVVLGTALLLGERRWARESLLVWGCVAAFVPTLATLYAGQVSGLLYLCVALGIWAHERDRPMLAGAALIAGAALKIIPVVLVGYFLWRGDWRVAAGAVAGAAAIFIATLPFAGLDGWAAYFTDGLSSMHSSMVVHGPTNVTLNGAFLRLFTESGWGEPLTQAPFLVRPLWIGASLVVVAATMAACWPPLRRAGPVRFEVATILVALQLIAPYTWYLQLTLSLLPAFVVVLAGWRAGALGDRWPLGLLGVLAAVDLFGLAWHAAEGHVVILSLPVVPVLALWAALALVVRRRGGSLLQEAG